MAECGWSQHQRRSVRFSSTSTSCSARFSSPRWTWPISTSTSFHSILISPVDMAILNINVVLFNSRLHSGRGQSQQPHHSAQFSSPRWTWPILTSMSFCSILLSLGDMANLNSHIILMDMGLWQYLCCDTTAQLHIFASFVKSISLAYYWSSMMWVQQSCRVWQSHHVSLHRSRHSLMPSNWQYQGHCGHSSQGAIVIVGSLSCCCQLGLSFENLSCLPM